MPSNSPIDSGEPEPAPSTLYVVTTPIGNLDDVTLRALKILQRVDWIAAEDTRHTRQLLSAHGIAAARLISYHEHNEQPRTAELVEKLLQGESVALVTDAGTPTVSDPGYRLVHAAVAQGLRVVPVPGVSAAVTALSASGLATDAFTFAGFPARRKNKRLQQLEDLAAIGHTLVFYQSPRRLLSFLEEILKVMGDRPAVVARELTKLHEEFIRGSITEVTAVLRRRGEIKGECTLLVGAAAEERPAARQSLEEEEPLRAAVAEALAGDRRPLPSVARDIARRLGRSRKEIYDLALRLREEQHREPTDG